MLGQAHTPSRRLLALAVLALVVLTAPAVVAANSSHGVSSLRAHDAEIAARSRSAVLALYSLDERLARSDAQLATLHRESASLEATRTELRLQLSIARRGTRSAERRLAHRVRVLYEQGSVEPLEVLFGAKSLDEVMTNLDDLSRVSSQGEDVLAELKAAKLRLGAAERRLAARESALAAATAQAEAAAAELRTAHAQRAAYVASLAAQRRLTRNRISALLARAQAAQKQSTVLTRSIAPAPAPAASADIPAPAAVDGRTLRVTATGYSLAGSTSTGLPVGWGVAAVDPSVIPLGTHMSVPGYGEAVAADTGGAVGGATIDLWFPTVAQANAWGRRTVTVVLH